MALELFRLRAMLVKTEVTEGTDSVPVPGTNALQVINGQGRLETDQLSREIDYPVFTGRPFVRTRKRATLSGQIELLGAASVGTAAPASALLQAAGHAETLDAGVDTVYNPVSTGIPSVSAYFYHGGERYIALGARGALTEIMLAINDFPKAGFEIQGNPTVDEQALPAGVDYSAFQDPEAIATENFTLSIDGFDVDGVSITLNTNSTLQLVEHTEGRVTRITDRTPSGTIRLYRPAVSDKAIRSLVDAHSRHPIIASYAPGAGKNVRLDVPTAQFGDPQPVDIDGFSGWDLPFTAIASASGNDEYLITFS